MFVDDRPIESGKEDRLGRISFSNHLARAIIDWTNPESLVVALCGKWGSGKSSVINLVKEEITASKSQDKPTVIEFNPWLFSGEEKLNEHFFTEIAKELEIKNEATKDRELANRFRTYSRLLCLVPEKGHLNEIIEKGLIVAGLFGLSSGQILTWLRWDLPFWKPFIVILGFVALILSLSRGTIAQIADYFEERSKAHQKSVGAFKKEINEALLKRSRKIIIIIDDIDRLTPEEVRIVFKLIKVNTDFPNLLYLLSFDRDVVRCALDQQPGVSGQDYLEKIVQVNFDIPFTPQEKIAKILFSELDRIMGTLPASAHKLFERTYWGNVYQSGLKHFFKNIRDVKRFSSSLELNLSLLHREKTIEVNPIDFISIEAIRVFFPEFYNFVRTRNSLFTSTTRARDSSPTSGRRQEIEQGLVLVAEPQRAPMQELVGIIFPQIGGVLEYGYSTHGPDWISEWNKNLRICSPEYFDAYFTFIPGGDESELSQFEIELILDAVADQTGFEQILRESMAKDKIRKVLNRLQDYTRDSSKIPQSAWPNVVQTLCNISDDLPKEKSGMFDRGVDSECMRIIYNLLKQNPDQNENFGIFKAAIEKSKGLSGPIYLVSDQTRRGEREDSDWLLVSKEKLGDLQQACVAKIMEHRSAGTLQEVRSLAPILYLWKEWSPNEDWKEFINEITSSNIGFLNFLKTFGSEDWSHSAGDYVERKRWRINYKTLSDFTSLEDVQARLERTRSAEIEFYLENKELIDRILHNFGKDFDYLDDE